MTQSPTRARTPLPGISSLAWEHPADQGALVALRKLKGFDSLIKAMSGLINERTVRLMLLGSSVRADERQFPVLHRLLADVGASLDAESLPELYVRASPGFNAHAIGLERPVIVIDSGLVALLDEEEMRFVIGHELGHVISGHAVYQTLLQRLLAMTGVFSAVPGGALGVRGILAALMEWSRKAELSADRAGLLAAQNPAAATRVHMKLASGGSLEHLDQTSFFAQASEYTETEDLRDSVLKVFLVEGRSHPFAVVRAAELRRWTESGAYTDILAGRYPRREDDKDAKVSDAAKRAAASYTESFRRSQDALGRLVHEAAGFVGAAKIWIDQRFGPRDA